jgi:hypothetical protein
MKNDSNAMLLKIIETTGWMIGPALLTLHLFSFVLGKSGIYYETISEWGISVGVLFISMAYVTRIWK